MGLALHFSFGFCNQVGQGRYKFVGSKHSRKSYNKFSQLGIAYLKTPYYVSGSHHQYATNVTGEKKIKENTLLFNRFGVYERGMYLCCGSSMYGFAKLLVFGVLLNTEKKYLETCSRWNGHP